MQLPEEYPLGWIVIRTIRINWKRSLLLRRLVLQQGPLAGICADFAIATGGVGGVIIAAAGGAAAGVINYVGTQGINDQEIDGGDLAISAVFGAVTNLLTYGNGRWPGNQSDR